MLNKWLDENSEKTAASLIKINEKNITGDTISGFGMKNKVETLIELLRSAIFPNIFSTEICSKSEIHKHVTSYIKQAGILLDCMIAEVLVNACDKRQRGVGCDKCREDATKFTVKYLAGLPQIAEILNTDIAAAYSGDPAAVSAEEILLAYPGFDAVSIHRLAHPFYLMGIPLLARIMAQYAHSKTGIDIHPGAQIDEYFFIDHGTGVVIGETCSIGKHVKIYQGVTLGAKSFPLDEKGNPIKGIKRHPNIEDNVIIYAGATVLGGDTTVGHNSIIGGNVWLTQSTDPYSTVYNATPSPVIRQ